MGLAIIQSSVKHMDNTEQGTMETMYTAVKNYGDCDQCILLETADMSEAVACAKYEIGAGECNVEVVYFVDGEVREVSL